MKTPTRVKSVLQQVYTDDKTNVDEDLADFIIEASNTPGAFDVFYASTVMKKPMRPVRSLLGKIQQEGIQTHMLWGENDPW